MKKIITEFFFHPTQFGKNFLSKVSPKSLGITILIVIILRLLAISIIIYLDKGQAGIAKLEPIGLLLFAALFPLIYLISNLVIIFIYYFGLKFSQVKLSFPRLFLETSLVSMIVINVVDITKEFLRLLVVKFSTLFPVYNTLVFQLQLLAICFTAFYVYSIIRNQQKLDEKKVLLILLSYTCFFAFLFF